MRIDHTLRVISLLVGFTAFSSVAKAEQFTLIDVEFTFTKEQADNALPSPSHYYVYGDTLVPGQPSNWTTPVDFRNGSVHVRTEVIEKPAGDAITQWSYCYIPNVGIGQGYGCTSSGTYTAEGVHERDESMTTFWENGSIDWTAGIKEMHLVIKDADGGNGHAHKNPEPLKYFPTTVRVTMVQVSAGSTYDEALVPELAKAPPVAGTGGASSQATGGTSGQGAGGSSGGSSGSGSASADSGGGGLVGTGSGGTGTAEAGGTSNGSDGGDSEKVGKSSGCEYGASRAATPTSGNKVSFAGLLLFYLLLCRRKIASSAERTDR